MCIRDRYRTLTLSKDGKQKRCRVHALVLEAFVGPRPKGYQCNHIDEDKGNNRLDNLEWVTPRQNRMHSYYAGSKIYNTCQNFAKGYANPTPVRAIHSGKWYPSQKAAELELGLVKGFITLQFQGRAHKNHFYQFKLAEEI